MFALIIAIVSIALIVATIAATMYHGGDTLTQGRASAEAAGIVSGAQQVGGAAVMHLSLDGARAASVAELVTDGYLSSEPAAASFTITSTGDRLVTASVDVATKAGVCDAINKAAGAAVVVVDNKNTYPVVAGDLADLPYGCVSTTGAFSFKY